MTIVYVIEQWDTATGTYFPWDSEEYQTESAALEALRTEKQAEPCFGGRFRITAGGESDPIDL